MNNILRLKTAQLKVDFERKFLVITWNGKVELKDYKTILVKAVEISTEHQVYNIIINRLNLDELSTECRVWMKGYFLKTIVKPLIPKLSKVATVEAKSAIGQIYTNTISKTVSLAYPNLKFKSFKNQDNALEWVGYSKAVPVKTELEPELEPQVQNTPFEQAENNDPGSLMDKFFKLFFKSSN